MGGGRGSIERGLALRKKACIGQGGFEHFLIRCERAVLNRGAVLIVHHFQLPAVVWHAMDVNFNRTTIGRAVVFVCTTRCRPSLGAHHLGLGESLAVASQTIIGSLAEQIRMRLVPVFHRLQRCLALQGTLPTMGACTAPQGPKETCCRPGLGAAAGLA